jgi:putative membrane protein
MPTEILRWLVATVHLLALPLGLAAVWARARALSRAHDPNSMRAAFLADSIWGIAALLWISTGLWRALGTLDKGLSFYMTNPLFHAKMGLLGVILLLEIWPMVTLIQWRSRVRKGWSVETARARTFSRISYFQALLVVLMVLAATAMARGVSL